jgi:hypothetical protein
MHDDIDIVDSPPQPILVTDIPREEPTAIVVECFFECGQAWFTLVENADNIRITFKNTPRQDRPNGAGSAGDENIFAVYHYL